MFSPLKFVIYSMSNFCDLVLSLLPFLSTTTMCQFHDVHILNNVSILWCPHSQQYVNFMMPTFSTMCQFHDVHIHNNVSISWCPHSKQCVNFMIIILLLYVWATRRMANPLKKYIYIKKSFWSRYFNTNPVNNLSLT